MAVILGFLEQCKLPVKNLFADNLYFESKEVIKENLMEQLRNPLDINQKTALAIKDRKEMAIPI